MPETCRFLYPTIRLAPKFIWGIEYYVPFLIVRFSTLLYLFHKKIVLYIIKKYAKAHYITNLRQYHNPLTEVRGYSDDATTVVIFYFVTIFVY